MDALEYQSDVVEPDGSRHSSERKTDVFEVTAESFKKMRMEEPVVKRSAAADPQVQADVLMKAWQERVPEAYDESLRRQQEEHERDNTSREALRVLREERAAIILAKMEEDEADEAIEKEVKNRMVSAVRASLNGLGYSRDEVDQILSSRTVLPGDTSKAPLLRFQPVSRRQSNPHSRFAGPSQLRKNTAQQRLEEAASKARRRCDEVTVALNQRIEFERRAAGQAKRIYEEEANAWETKALEHQRRDLAAAEAHRRHDSRAVAPTKPRVTTDYDSSDGTADDDIEKLVRKWTNLYDQESAAVQGAAAEQDLGVQGAVQDVPAARLHRPPAPLVVDGLENSCATSSSISSESSVSNRPGITGSRYGQRPREQEYPLEHRSPQVAPRWLDSGEESYGSKG